MPLVDIKGVGQAQFPDNMSKQQIGDFLRKKYMDRLMAPPTAPQPRIQTVEPTTPTLAERGGQFVSDALFDTGVISDRGRAQRIGGNIATLGEFLPGIGDATAGDEFGRAVREGDKLGAGVAALGAIPVVGDVGKGVAKGVKNVIDEIPKTKLPWEKTKAEFDMPAELKGKEAFKVQVGDKDIRVLQNPSDAQMKALRKDAVDKHGDSGVVLRVTRDDDNNAYYWDAYDAMHDQVEPKLGKQVGVKLNQNKGRKGDHFSTVRRAIYDGENVPQSVIDEYPGIVETVSSIPGNRVKKVKAASAMSVGKPVDYSTLPYGDRIKAASEWETGKPIKLKFARNKESAPPPAGMDFGQKIEPAGRYMNVDFNDTSFNKNIPNWEFGEIEFKNPLVLDHKNTRSTGWKKDLSDMFGGSTGKRLSNKVKKAGYDGIITKDADGFNETISLK